MTCSVTEPAFLDHSVYFGVLTLEAAFVICRMVLKYLIPVKLSLGVMPSKSLLEQYGLLEVCEQ